MSAPVVDGAGLERRREQRAWNWYDWAISAFHTTVLTVLFGPFMITIAGRAAGCADDGEACTKTVEILGLDLAAGSLPSYLTSFATIAGAVLLPIVGALIDGSGRKKWHLAWFAWSGAFFCALLFFMQGDHWQIGAVAVVVSSILAGCSTVCYYAILVDISTEEERDRVSAHGWAFGYLGAGLMLAFNLVLVQGHEFFGLDTETAVRISLLSAALWWAGFTLIPVRRLRNRPPAHPPAGGRGLVRSSFGELWATFRQMRRFKMTLVFLLAYLFYNDGIQTVIYSASIYGSKELHLDQSILIAAILLIQFVAFGGALLFGRVAARIGAYRCLVGGTVAWMLIVAGAYFLPERNIGLFLVAGTAIGLVMGGTQALSRSFFSLLIPAGREGAYFAFYQAAERGTSWFGTLLFGLIFQLTGSYRPAIVSLVIFFVLGLILLLLLDPRRGIREAGNRVPSTL